MRVIVETEQIRDVFIDLLSQYTITYDDGEIDYEDVADELVEAIILNEDD